MKTLHVICYLCSHPEIDKVFIMVNGKAETEGIALINAIHYFASIDPSWYDDFHWNISNAGSFNQETITISR